MKFADTFITVLDSQLEVDGHKLRWTKDGWNIVLKNGHSVRLLELMEVCILHHMDFYKEIDRLALEV